MRAIFVVVVHPKFLSFVKNAHNLNSHCSEKSALNLLLHNLLLVHILCIDENFECASANLAYF